MKRADMSLFILSKMAMIFFIIALMGILLVFSGREKASLCSQQANQISAEIATTISQAMNSPLEDERRVVSFSPNLVIGEGRDSRYNISITKRDPANAGEEGMFSIETKSIIDSSCSGGAKTFFPPSIEFKGEIAISSKLWLTPSALEKPPAPSKRTKYLIVLKCTTKDQQRQKIFVLEDCNFDDPDPKAIPGCISFEDYPECEIPIN